MNKFVFSMNNQCCNIIKHLPSPIYCISPIQLYDECSPTTLITTCCLSEHILQCKICHVIQLSFLRNILLNFLTVNTTLPIDSAQLTMLWTAKNLNTSLGNSLPDFA